MFCCIYLVSLPPEQNDNEKIEDEIEEEKEEEEEESSSERNDSLKTLLLVYRIMYYPTFDCCAFPPRTKSMLVSATSRQTLDDQVGTALQAR